MNKKTESSRFFEVKGTQKLPKIGQCIYCGTKEHLTDEHVIPFGLGGRLILPKSSCKKCAVITSSFEMKVLRGFMYEARVAGLYPTRRQKDRPSELNVQLGTDEKYDLYQLPISEFPGLLQLPVFEPPGFLAGREATRGVKICGIETISFGKNPVDVLKQRGLKSIKQTTDLDATSFARMLAKIGYSYAVGIHGLLPLQDVPVLPLILGESDDGNVWVGSAPYKTESERRGATHALATYKHIPENMPGCRMIISRVKLFAGSGATGYEVVVYYKDYTI